MRRFHLQAMLLALCAAMPLPGDNATSPGPAVSTPDALLTGLIKACEKNDVTQAQLLIAQGAPVDAPYGSYHLTPLLVASGTSPGIVALLIDKKVRIDQIDLQGNTALNRACYFKQRATVLALLEAGADPSLANFHGRTPVGNATITGDDVLIKALAAHHADLNAHLPKADPPLWWAVHDNRLDLAKLLLDLGADPKVETLTTPLFEEAADHNNIEMLDLLKARGADINQTVTGGYTSLIGEAGFGTPEAVHLLLERGADPNLATNAGYTPLMRAAIKTPSALQDLIDHGARLEARTNDGSTALILSCWANSEPNVRNLVEHGADVNAADPKGETPLLCAGDLGAMNIVDYLKQKGATNTELRILAKDTPPHPLPSDRRWALAVAALYVQITGYNPQILGWDGYSKRGARKGLAIAWEITDKADLQAEIKNLVPPSHEETVSGAYEGLPDLVAAVQAWFRLYPGGRVHPGLAGDLCRATNLINTGYQAGYLTEDECWPLLLDIARRAQANFSSWQELSNNFLQDRAIWSGERNPQFEACAKLLLNPKDPNSPWNQNPWNTPLPPP